MLGESGDRGAILEQCLCKLMHQRNENSEKIQIIGMSATLANTDELCAFLSAKKYQTNFRPVRVLERIKLHDELYQVDTEGSWQLELHLPKKNIPVT
jgi:DNA polymerase theta